MKIKAAILDDETLFCDVLQGHLKEWGRGTSNAVDISAYHNSDQFLTDWNSNEQFDVVFLDIILFGSDVNGMEIAHIIRERNENIPLVFTTSVKHYLSEGYFVEAVRYLMKPLEYPDVKDCMDRVYIKINSIQNTEFLLKYKHTVSRTPYKDILYFSSANHNAELHLRDGNVYKHMEKFNALIKTLPATFMQCHRGIIVNIEAIYSIDHNNVILVNGERLPISESYLAEVSDCFMLYFG